MSFISKSFTATRRLVLAGAAVFGLSACDFDPSALNLGLGGAGGSTAPLKIAVMVPGGSGDANLNSLATGFRQAAQMARASFPDRQVELMFYNTGGDAGRAAGQAQQAAAAGAQAIVGPLFAEAANAAGNAVSGANLNVIAFSNNASIAGGNLFVLGETFEDKAARIMAHAKTQGIGSVTLIAPNNAVGEVAGNAARRASARTGVRLDGISNYEFSPDGIVQASAQIAQQVKAVGSQSILLTADSDAGLSIFAEMLPASGLPPQAVKYMGLTRWDIPTSNLSIPGLRGGWFVVPDLASVQGFENRYLANYGAKPHPLAGLAYDGVLAAIQAGAARGKPVAASALTKNTGFKGASGIFRLRPDGSNQRALAVAENIGTTYRIISSAPSSFGGFGS